MNFEKIFISLSLLLMISMRLLSCDKEAKNRNHSDNSTLNKQVLVELVNQYRKKGCNCGSDYFPPVQSVRWNDTLELAAKAHSKDMEAKNFFNHTGSDNSSPGDRINKYSYKWSIYGENIAYGYYTEKDIITSWLASPAHCSNIMDAKFKEMGVAKSGLFWTQLFASH